MRGSTHVAVDLGATSGRVIAGRVDGGRLVTQETARFANVPVTVPGPGGRTTMHWDLLRLWRGAQEGLAAAGRLVGPVASVGVDGWAVDYGLLDADGALLGNPVHYRDPRTAGAADRLFASLPAARHHAITGLQVQPFNTVFQLVAAAGEAATASARRLLLLPDLLTCWLTGAHVAELTNASTTGLLDVTTRTWSGEVLTATERVTGLDVRGLLPDVVAPGTRVGGLRPAVGRALGLDGAEVVTVGSHDTASAVAAVPMARATAAYISSGTWSLVGLELDRPVLTEASRAANFTNELGIEGTVRFLRNVTGLWLLEQSLATWRDRGEEHALPALLAAAADVPGLRCVVDVDDPAFAAPGDVPARIREVARRTGQPVPTTAPELVRVVLDSLALAYRRAVREAADLAGHAVETVHVVGGGSRNALLCSLTADATGLPVVAGPDEATAVGNLLVQAATAGEVSGGLDGMRAVVRASTPLRRYEPRGDGAAWDRAEKVLHG